MNHNGIANFGDAECQCAIDVLVGAFPIDPTRFSDHLDRFDLLDVHVAAPVVDEVIIS
jgi:hypothetical protein